MDSVRIAFRSFYRGESAAQTRLESSSKILRSTEYYRKMFLPLPIGNGKGLSITATLVYVNVPFMLGKDTLQIDDVVESNREQELTLDAGDSRVFLKTLVSEQQGMFVSTFRTKW